MSEQAVLIPHNEQAEQAVLGSMLVTLSAVDAAFEGAGLRPEHFYRPRHRAICEAIVGLYGGEGAIEPIRVIDRLRQDGKLDEAGGPDVVMELAGTVAVPANAGRYAEMVIEQSRLRSTLQLTQAIARRIQAGEDESGELLQEIERQTYELLCGTHTQGELTPISGIVEAATDRYERRAAGERIDGLRTGFPTLDRHLQGLVGGRLIIVASRPGHGKSTLALNIAEHVARKEKRGVALFSLEMSEEEIADKLLSQRGTVEGADLATGSLDTEGVRRLTQAANELYGLDLHIDDSSHLTLPMLRARCRRLQARLGDKLGLVVVDYLQLLTASQRSRESNRVAEVSEISRELKILAGELGLPLLVCAQVGRGAEQRADKMPILSDLRESGSIENDANQVLFIHNPALYETGEADPFADPREQADDAVRLHVAKNRHNSTGHLKLSFEGSYSRFRELDLTSW